MVKHRTLRLVLVVLYYWLIAPHRYADRQTVEALMRSLPLEGK